MAQIPQSDKVDRKDLALMEMLAQNCRLSHVTMGKALKLSKDAVAYRLHNLESNGWISQYMLFIDARRLGFTRHHILLRLESTIRAKRQIIDRICANSFVMWVNSFIGRYDIQIIVDATDGFHLNQIKEDLLQRCSHQVQEYTILTHLSDLEFTQLNPVLNLGTQFNRLSDASFSGALTTRKFPVDVDFEVYEPSLLEIKVLKILADNPRSTLLDVARLANCDRQTAKSRILNLIKRKIILNFGGIPSLNKLGFVTYYLLVRIRQDTPLKSLKRPFNQLRNIFYAGRMLGDSDLILYLNARSPQELNDSIELFRSDLGEHIQHYELLVQDKVHYWRQFTPGILDHLRSQANMV